MYLEAEGLPPDLNPGIRKTVAWLRSLGFATCDSGDGVTHDYSCDQDVAFVAIRVDKRRLVEESERLQKVISDRAFSDGNIVLPNLLTIDATYSPLDGVAVVLLRYLNDSILQFHPGEFA